MVEEELEDLEEFPEEEKTSIFTKKFFMLTLVPVWAFFIIFFIIILFSVGSYKDKWAGMVERYNNKIMAENKISLPDSIATLDSMTVKVGTSEWDSLFFNELLTPDDKLTILNIENSRRQKEIDYLYEQIVGQKEYIEKLHTTLGDLAPEKTISMLLEQYPHLALAPPEEEEVIEEPVIEEPVEEELPYKPEAIQSSAKIYASMKPETAADILSSIDERVASAILVNISQRKAAKILEVMDKRKATALSQLMVTNS
jgi:hypothetical protein